LLDGRLEISNNRAEREIKPFVLGRKNWLFSNTAKGATASAIAYSIIETAKANSLNPFYYLTFLFERLPNIDTNNIEQLDALLPWSTSLPNECKCPQKKGYHSLHLYLGGGYLTLTEITKAYLCPAGKTTVFTFHLVQR